MHKTVTQVVIFFGEVAPIFSRRSRSMSIADHRDLLPEESVRSEHVDVEF